MAIPEPDPNDPVPQWLHEHIMAALRPALERLREINTLERMWAAGHDPEQ
ncbi:hypothetical protein [Planobispora rosea]|nr:hypothetical protein [Planobispora rosea]